ncbi:MAG TPA: MBL fold metallo-hydrolase, partial [Mycobacterium sp.]|nr:MBL fold metallo-hydrolase [Mycobacterium sp.]
YHYGTLDGTPVPRALTAMESLVAFDRKTVQANHVRLVELYRRQDPDLMIVCAHDPTLYERAKAIA